MKIPTTKNSNSKGILRAGEQLKKYFPWKDGDSNELSNEISKG